MTKPYTLVVASHKGGSGRTLSTAALAVILGRSGHKVAILDASSVPALTEIADNAEWENVELVCDEGLQSTPDYVIIDCPPLSEPDAVSVLAYSDGALITCPPEPLAFRTIPTATKAMLRAREENPNLEILGVCLTSFRDQSSLHQSVLSEMRDSHPDVILEPVVPADADFGNWALNPSNPPWDGPAFAAYRNIADQVEAARQRSLTKPEPNGLEELVAAIAREDEADAAERQLVADLNWCEVCGWSIPRKQVRNGSARRNEQGQMSCVDCLVVPVASN